MPMQHYAFWPDGVPKNVTLPETTLTFNLEVSARRYPDKPALIFYGTAISFARLLREVEALAGFLQQRCGVGKGDRVLLYMQNSPQFIIAYYAILRADAVVVPVNPMNRTVELRHYLTDSDARIAFVGSELYANVLPLLKEGLQHAIVATYADYLETETDLQIPDAIRQTSPGPRGDGITHWKDALALALTPGPVAAGPDDLCVMPYTSGTTGMPKGCMHTHRSVMHTTVASALWVSNSQDSTLLVVMPFFHVAGMQSGINVPIFSGSTIVILPRWDRNVAAQLIERYKIDAWGCISTMMIDFLNSPEIHSFDLSSIRRISGGGAAMPDAIAQKIHDLWGIKYIEGYGLSETMAPTHINPLDHPKKQCLGIPICDTDARVIDLITLAELPAGEIGEIIVNGPQVFRGYWKNETATRETFITLDGKSFFRTGDLGRIDEQGYFFIVDRVKRMINASGYKVWPAEVEMLLYGYGPIQEVCIISSASAARGETVKAVVVLKDACRGKITEDDVIEWSREHMAAYKIPRQVTFVDALPKSVTGKILWRELQEREKRPDTLAWLARFQ